MSGNSNRNAARAAGMLAQLTIDVRGDGSAAVKIRVQDVAPKKGEGKLKDPQDKEDKVSPVSQSLHFSLSIFPLHRKPSLPSCCEWASVMGMDRHVACPTGNEEVHRSCDR
jgi:hypothetical protein